MILTEIHIENFQSHRRTEIKLHPGVIAIVGSSDSGKSVIPRAIRWVVFNKPEGQSFRSVFDGKRSKVTSVALFFSNGSVVRRIRTSSRNEYVVTQALKNKASTQTFEQVGKGVPDEVAEILNFSDLNFQRQHDPSFLLSSSPIEISRRLNEVTNLDVIDRVQGNLHRMGRRAEGEISEIKRRIEEARGSIEAFGDLDNLDVDLAVLEAKEVEGDGLEQRVRALWDLINRMDSLDVSSAALLEAEPELIRVERLVEKREGILKQYRDLGAVGIQIRKVEKDRASLSGVLNLEEEVVRLEEQTKYAHQLRGAIELLEHHGRCHDFVTKELKTMVSEFHKLMPEECPLCRQGIVRSGETRSRRRKSVPVAGRSS